MAEQEVLRDLSEDQADRIAAEKIDAGAALVQKIRQPDDQWALIIYSAQSVAGFVGANAGRQSDAGHERESHVPGADGRCACGADHSHEH